MRVLLASTGLETQEIKEYFVNMLGKDMSIVKTLFLGRLTQHKVAFSIKSEP